MSTAYRALVILGVFLAVLMAFSSTKVLGGDLTRPDRVGYIYPPYSRMSVGLEVLVDGSPVRTISHAGKTYLPVTQLGTEYQIRVQNYGSRRIVAIVSVDGLSVLNGKPASEHQSGYIVDAHSHILIKGWRRDMDTVAAFSFEEREKSYAARMGRPENLGVIGLIAVEEEGSPIWLREEMKDSAKRALAPSGIHEGYGKDVGGIGTGYGRDVESHIYYVPFVRSANKRTVTIYYDTVEALRRAGVPVDWTYPVPFPVDTEFVPPPPPFPGYRFN
jgi:hypothetical protein